jgi:hypothetical protein
VVGWFVSGARGGAEQYSGQVCKDRRGHLSSKSDSLPNLIPAADVDFLMPATSPWQGWQPRSNWPQQPNEGEQYA